MGRDIERERERESLRGDRYRMKTRDEVRKREVQTYRPIEKTGQTG